MSDQHRDFEFDDQEGSRRNPSHDDNGGFDSDQLHQVYQPKINPENASETEHSRVSKPGGNEEPGKFESIEQLEEIVARQNQKAVESTDAEVEPINQSLIGSPDETIEFELRSPIPPKFVPTGSRPDPDPLLGEFPDSNREARLKANKQESKREVS